MSQKLREIIAETLQDVLVTGVLGRYVTEVEQ